VCGFICSPCSQESVDAPSCDFLSSLCHTAELGKVSFESRSVSCQRCCLPHFTSVLSGQLKTHSSALLGPLIPTNLFPRHMVLSTLPGFIRGDSEVFSATILLEWFSTDAHMYHLWIRLLASAWLLVWFSYFLFLLKHAELWKWQLVMSLQCKALKRPLCS
jgi:hypothetical protein